jgi:spore coat polysaccharide biosynthesis predicted glycosyltransferase SpsG
MISMGLTDVGAITIDVLDAVLAADTGAAIDVVMGSIAPSLEPVLDRARRHPEVSVHVDTTRMCDLIAAADIGVGAGGTTIWERCCLGLPTVSMVLAENQRRLSEALSAAGAIMLADSHQAVGDAVRTLVRSPATLRDLSSAAAAVTDGTGSARIIAKIGSAARANADDAAARIQEE